MEKLLIQALMPGFWRVAKDDGGLRRDRTQTNSADAAKKDRGIAVKPSSVVAIAMKESRVIAGRLRESR